MNAVLFELPFYVKPNTEHHVHDSKTVSVAGSMVHMEENRVSQGKKSHSPAGFQQMKDGGY